MSNTTGRGDDFELRTDILRAISSFEGAVFTRKQACANRAQAASQKVFASLVREGAIVSLGKCGRHVMFAARTPEHEVRPLAAVLAARHLDELERDRHTLANRLAPISVTKLRNGSAAKKLPTAVRSLLLDELRRRKASGAVFTFKIGPRDYFLFASDMRAALGASPERAAANSQPLRDAASQEERIVQAYWSLRESTGLRNVPISDVLKQSGVERSALHKFLNRARYERRANASLGEPTAATEEQLSAALTIEGRPHIYIELFEGSAS